MALQMGEEEKLAVAGIIGLDHQIACAIDLCRM